MKNLYQELEDLLVKQQELQEQLEEVEAKIEDVQYMIATREEYKARIGDC